MAALACIAAASAFGDGAKIGSAAPAFSLRDAEGRTHELASYKGQFVVLEWFNDGCPFVKKHYQSGNMQRLQKELAEKGVVWLSISSSARGKEGYLTSDSARQRVAEWNMQSTKLLLDSDATVARLYGAKSTPHMFVIDKEGLLIYHGAIDNKPTANTADLATAENYVRLALESAMNGKPVATPMTRPYGCALKY